MKNSSRIVRASVVLILIACAPVSAGVNATPIPVEPGDAGVFPQTAMGKCAAAFVEMVNLATPEAVSRFEGAWASKTRAAQRSIEDRVTGIQKLHADWGRVTVVRVEDKAGTVVVNAKGSTGFELEMEFKPDGAEVGKLASVMIKGSKGAASGPIDAKQRDLVVRSAANVLVNSYVFPEVGEKMAEAVTGALEKGAYDSITDERAFAEKLTEDLRAISHDKHLRVSLSPVEPHKTASFVPEGDEARRENYAFRKVEVLPGNIGYVKFDLFLDGEQAQKTAAAAMGFVRNCDAVIFDLRTNGGGSPEMIRFLSSYFLPAGTHLNSMVDRSGNIVEEFKTLDKVPGEKLADGVPIFVLTSSTTFSGAEEFSYNLKNLKRATIVGETTGGGAHPVKGERLTDRFMIGVPFMRAMNPISKTNWEGVGVEPDVKVEAGKALDRAMELAQQATAARAKK